MIFHFQQVKLYLPFLFVLLIIKWLLLRLSGTGTSFVAVPVGSCWPIGYCYNLPYLVPDIDTVLL